MKCVFYIFCSFYPLNIEYRFLDPLYQINVARLREPRFFYTRLLIKIRFNTEYACRISLIHMIWILALYMLFLSFLTLIIGILIHGIKSMCPHWTRLGFFTRDYLKICFNSEYACRISSIHMIRFLAFFCDL